MSKERIFTDSRVVPASPEEIFALLADPVLHCEFDGSGTVRRVVFGEGPMQLGSKFKIAMKHLGWPYKITNTVVEFEENRRIAWSHWGRHRWRFELEPVEGGTLTTESVDFTDCAALNRLVAMKMHPPKRQKANIAATLDNLAKRFAES